MELLLVFHQTKVLPDLWEKLKGSGYRKPEVLRAFHSSSAYQHFLVEVSFFFLISFSTVFCSLYNCSSILSLEALNFLRSLSQRIILSKISTIKPVVGIDSYLLERCNFVCNWSYALHKVWLGNVYIIEVFIIRKIGHVKPLI